MNGYDATKQIRMYEGGRYDGNGVPIVAMTANNTQKEVERCSASGMDDFLSKPLRINELKKMLLKWVPVDQGEMLGGHGDDAVDFKETTQLNIPGDGFDPLVIEELKGSVGEVLVSMIEAFLEDTPVYLQSLQHAILDGDAKKVRELAHTVKGSASNFGARRVVDLSKILEERGAIDYLVDAENLHKQLKEAYASLSKELQDYIVGSDSDAHLKRNTYSILVVDDDRSMRLALKNVSLDGDSVGRRKLHC